VLSNHDVVRHATRFGYDGQAPRDGDGIGTWDPQPDEDLGRSRAAAASLFMLGLPGGAYLYQGEELGLPDGIDIPDTRRQDPTFARTGGARLGRDGCRVPLPWRAGERNAGFGHGQDPWLPQPESFSRLARDVQAASPSSHLSLYKRMLEARRRLELGRGSLSWYEDLCTDTSLAFLNGSTLVLLNVGSEPLDLPAGRVLLRSSTPPGVGYDTGDMTSAGDPLSSCETVWLEIYLEDTEG
jgi:alpha-glucosidase